MFTYSSKTSYIRESCMCASMQGVASLFTYLSQTSYIRNSQAYRVSHCLQHFALTHRHGTHCVHQGGLKIEKITCSNRLIVIFMVVHICFMKINVITSFNWFLLGGLFSIYQSLFTDRLYLLLNSKRIRVYLQVHLGNNMCLPKARLKLLTLCPMVGYSCPLHVYLYIQVHSCCNCYWQQL